jgi:hypothetical protein
MNALSVDVSLLAMSLDHARMGLDAARAQQPADTPGNPAASAAQQTGVVLELSAAAQALLKT